MSLFIKICGLSTVADVAAAVSSGADAVGFVFADSPRQVEPAAAALAAGNLPPGVLRVAVMRHPSNDDWRRVLDVFRPQALQTDAEDFDELEVPDGVMRWPVFREGRAAVERVPAGTYLYEGRDSGRGETVDWTRAFDVGRNGQMILAGGLDADNVAGAIRVARPWGVDVSSGVESRLGRKDPALIRKFIQAARAAESDL